MLDTISSYSDDVCERIIKVDLHADMLSYLGWDTLSTTADDISQSKVKGQFLDWVTSILYNVVARTDTAREALRQHQAFHILHKFRDVTQPAVTRVLVFKERLHCNNTLN